jgi:hypothetical protein
MRCNGIYFWLLLTEAFESLKHPKAKMKLPCSISTNSFPICH